MATTNITVGKFEDDAADIMLDGKAIGWIERVKGERFRSATSYARVSFVSHYEVNLTDDALNEKLTEALKSDVHHFDSKADAVKAVRALFA